MRRRRFLWVAVRAGVFAGVLLGLILGGLTASVVTLVLHGLGIKTWPFFLLLPAMVFGSGVLAGTMIAFADGRITRSTPEDRLDPIGAVRQWVTLEIPVSPDAALEAISRLVFEEMLWTIEGREIGRLLLRAPKSFKSFGEQVTIDLHPTPSGSAVLIHSRPLSRIVVVDYNKNRENVLLLREKIMDRVGVVTNPRDP